MAMSRIAQPEACSISPRSNRFLLAPWEIAVWESWKVLAPPRSLLGWPKLSTSRSGCGCALKARLQICIEVWTMMNVQHIESLNDQVWQITGIQVRETVPDAMVRQAAEIVAVDVTPDALLNRLKRGAVYKPEMVEKALSGFFKGSNLGALRELTLRQAAHEVDLRQSAYDETRGFQVPRVSEARVGGATNNQPKERILIHITADPSTAMLIRRGRRVADYLRSDCTALFVHQTPEP